MKGKIIIMSERGETWVHGNAAIVQFPGGGGVSPYTPGHVLDAVERGTPFSSASGARPWTDIVGLVEGPGVTFAARRNSPNTNFFHFPFTTPVVISDASPQLKGISVDRISVFWEGHNAFLTNIYWFNGSHGKGVINLAQIPATGNTAPTGSQLGSLVEGVNTFYLPQYGHAPVIPRQGFGISVEVQFADVEDARVTFSSAGIHYQMVAILLGDLDDRT